MSEIINALHWRYATKEFDTTKKISDSDLDLLLESLRLSPSSFGLQPWKFIVVKDKEKRALLQEAAYHQAQVTEASDLIVICRLAECRELHVDKYIEDMASKKNVSVESLSKYRNMMVSVMADQDADRQEEWMELQCYIALGFLMETAALMGIDTCPMEGFSKKKFDEILDLENDQLRSVIVCPVGYRSDNDKYAKEQKVRFNLDDLVIYK